MDAVFNIEGVEYTYLDLLEEVVRLTREGSHAAAAFLMRQAGMMPHDLEIEAAWRIKEAGAARI